MNRLFPLLLAVSALPLAACSSSSGEVTAIAFTQTVYELTIGDTAALKVVLTGGEKEVLFLSTNEPVATVNDKGVVQAKAVGEATIIAICNDHIARCAVTVNDDGVSDVAVYAKSGTLSLDLDSPAFGLSGKQDCPFTYVYQDGKYNMAYAEASLANGDLLQGLADMEESPFFLANPDVEKPELFTTIIDCAKSVNEGPFTAKTLYKDLVFHHYFYDGETYLDHMDFDPLGGLSAIDILADAGQFLNGEKGIADLVSLWGEEGGVDNFLRLLITMLFDTKVVNETIEGIERVTVTFGATAGQALLDYWADFDFGEEASIDELVLRMDYAKTEENKRELHGVGLTLAANLFGEENHMSYSLSLEKEKREMPMDFFHLMEEELSHK